MELERHGRTVEAEQEFLKAAALGEFNAMYNCGLLAERRGRTAEAHDWYVRAHNAGHPEAANNLGVLLHNAGDPDALLWFQLAAAMGHRQAAGNAKALLASRSRWAKRRKAGPEVLRAAAESAYREFTATGNDARLVRAVTLSREAVRLAGRRHRSRGRMLADLRDVLRYRYELRGDVADLEEAVSVALEALDGLASGHPERLTAAHALIALLNAQFEVTLIAGPLLKAVDEVGRPALRQRRGTEQARAALESSLCGALVALFRHADATVDLDEAITLGRAAVRRLPGVAVPLSNLGAALLLRGTQRGSLDDINEAVEVLREATAAATAAHDTPQLTRSSVNLISALRIRADLTGRAADDHEAEEAAERMRHAVSAEPTHHPRTLVKAVIATDGPTSADATRHALSVLPPMHTDRPFLLLHLAKALSADGKREEAIAAAREAAALAVSSQAKVDAQRILGRLLLSDDADDADDADDTDDGRRQAALAEAIEVLTASANALEKTEVVYAEVMTGLATALLGRFVRDGLESDHEAALDALRAASNAAGSSVQDRLFAARYWAGVALEAGDTGDALAASRVAVSLLSEFGWIGLDRGDQEQSLRDGAAMPRDAAALAIATGQPRLAVELLEQGRSVLWRSTLHLREDLAALAAKDPALAAELEQVRATLNGHAALSPESRMRLADQWTRLLGKVRQLRGFETFLGPPSFEALVPAAAKGPVVIVNISTIRCDALLVMPDGQVEVVPLPDVDVPEMDTVSNTYREHLALAQEPGATGRARERARHTVHDTLGWLWERIARPVLDRLAFSYASETPPRLWWCPTASLMTLPLHAAGRYPRTSADRTEPVGSPFAVVSSYTATLSALIDARRRPVATGAGVVAVALTDTGRGHDPLPGVATELGMLEEVFGRQRLTVLVDDAATVAAVREQLLDHTWAHFACHGSLDMASPTDSGLALRDGDMNVLDFADLPLETADLAFLSACHTAVGGGRLPDEAIHTAAALRMAGFRHVVATQWSVHDQAAPILAAAFYRHLGVSGPMDSAGAAVALHHAVAELRDANLTDPTLWVPFIHDGP
ncbi:CHAT domain-containing protein [Peterkaempfera bronchialis]|uniref:CHAT domain-containing protein n=1 Tax=Peterkaempfera bronchialis TaxID=2126346 RepID=UPI003C2BA656